MLRVAAVGGVDEALQHARRNVRVKSAVQHKQWGENTTLSMDSSGSSVAGGSGSMTSSPAPAMRRVSSAVSRDLGSTTRLARCSRGMPCASSRQRSPRRSGAGCSRSVRPRRRRNRRPRPAPRSDRNAIPCSSARLLASGRSVVTTVNPSGWARLARSLPTPPNPTIPRIRPWTPRPRCVPRPETHDPATTVRWLSISRWLSARTIVNVASACGRRTAVGVFVTADSSFCQAVKVDSVVAGAEPCDQVQPRGLADDRPIEVQMTE